MACTMFFGNPPPNMRQWILDHEAPSVEPIGQSEDGTVKVFSMTDQTGAQILTVGNYWRIDGVGLAPEGFTTSGWVLNSVRFQANGIDAEAQIVEGDSDKKHVVVRAESDIANPGNYNVIFYFDLQEYGSIESESFSINATICVPESESSDPSDPSVLEPIGQSEDGTVKVFSMTDQTGAEILIAGNNWRIDGAGLAPEGFSTEGWRLNSVRLEANEINAEATITEACNELNYITVRTDSDIANPGDYEVTFYFDLQWIGSIESESFTVTQMIRVPQSA